MKFYLIGVLFSLELFFNMGLAAPTNTPSMLVEHAITQEMLSQKMAAVKNQTDLEEAQKTKLSDLYQAALDNLRNDEAFQAASKRYQTAIDNSVATMNAQQQKLAAFQAQQKTLENFNKLTLEELTQRLFAEKSALNNLETQLAKTENEINMQELRATQIRQETEQTKQAVEENDKTNVTLNNLNGTSQEQEARQIHFKTTSNKLNSQLKMLGLEAISHPARLDLLKAQLQLLTLEKQALLPKLTKIEQAQIQRQQQEAQSLKNKLLKIEQQSLHKHPAIQLLTKENIEYSLELQAINDKLDKTLHAKEALEKQELEVDSDFKSAEKKITLAGLSPALGKVLREQRHKLAITEQFMQQGDTVQNETAFTNLAELKLETRLKQLVDVDVELKRVMAKYTFPNAAARVSIETEIQTLLNAQKELLTQLTQAHNLYLHSLGDYDFAKRQLLKQTQKYALYLDERLFWVASSASINWDYFESLYETLRWLLSPSHWQIVLTRLFYGLFSHFFFTFLTGVSLAALWRYQPYLQKQIVGMGIQVNLLSGNRFYLTLVALAYSFLTVLSLPLLLFFLGWLLENSLPLDGFNLAVAEGLEAVVAPLLFSCFLGVIFTPLGLVEQHFQWHPHTTQVLARQIAWAQRLALPAIFIMSLSNASQNTVYSDSLGRLALVVLMLVFAKVFSQLLHPEKGVLHLFIKTHPEHWLARWWRVEYGIGIAIPLIILLFSLNGYYLSALELEQKLLTSLLFCFVMVLLYELIVRGLSLGEEVLSLQNSVAKPLNLPPITQQTTHLLNVVTTLCTLLGFWLIWKNILPAFSFLDEIVLWQHLSVVDKQETLQAITLSNLLMAIIYLAFLLMTLKNFPNVLETVVFRYFSFELGSRYAIQQLSRYLLITIGIVMIVNELGGSWAQVQWLVAALSVGLGFGLQEIFANLVSGIILLFERPIRVGDTVTIGDVSGKVSQIQMRATHIIDWDKKELIVPNKLFITDKLVNWALSSQITRVVIPVNIAYGSDVDFAHQVMMDTVKNTPLVALEPSPDVCFIGFGESALQFSIQVYVSELSHRTPVTHDLHLRLYKALAKNHIEMPLPQQEIHIRSSENDATRSEEVHIQA